MLKDKQTKSLQFSFSCKCRIKMVSGEEVEELKEIAEGKNALGSCFVLEVGEVLLSVVAK